MKTNTEKAKQRLKICLVSDSDAQFSFNIGFWVPGSLTNMLQVR